MVRMKKIDRMHKLFGVCEEHTCKECSNYIRIRYRDKMLRKCQVYGLTHSEASDWAGKWTACGMFNQEYGGRPVIEIRPEQPQELEPLENQTCLF